MMPLPPAAHPLSRTQSRVSLQSADFDLPAAVLPVTWLQSTKSTHSLALSHARQAGVLIARQSAPQLLTVNGVSQTSGAVTLPSLQTGTSGMLAELQSGAQVAPGGVPGGKSVPSQGSPASRKPSAHFFTRIWQSGVQLLGSAGVGSHCSMGVSTSPLPQTANLQYALHLASPAVASHSSPGSCLPLPHSTLLQEMVVLSDLWHWPLSAVIVRAMSLPAPA